MTGGIDRGPCYSSHRLSHRQRFICQLWVNGGLFLPMLFICQLSGLIPGALWNLAKVMPAPWWSRVKAFGPHRIGWLLLGMLTVEFGANLGYTWFRWRREQRFLANCRD